MRILLITYHFPPDAEVGGVRPYQIARCLPDFGIEPWVLTVEPRFAESPNEGLVPEGVPEDRIIRTVVDATAFDRAKRLWRAAGSLRGDAAHAGPGRPADSRGGSTYGAWAYRILGFPDPLIGWRRPALRAAEQVMRRVRFDAILSTSPPRVATLVAAELARRHGLPWVMDLRDPWWGNYRNPQSHDGRYALDALLQQRLFRRCVSGATLVVHNTERLRQLTCRIAPDASARTRSIQNGCESGWQARRDAGAPTSFRIGYYGQMMGLRSAAGFLQGLRSWLDSRRPPHSSIGVRFVGTGFEAVRRQAQELGLQDIVELNPPVPRVEVPALMARDFALLLVANAQPLQVPGKTYEYLAAGRRILALTEHDGATADLLRFQEGCIVAERPEEVHAALDQLHGDYEADREGYVDRGDLLAELQYSRRVEEFAALLNEVVRH